jgi:hypothetical protein
MRKTRFGVTLQYKIRSSEQKGDRDFCIAAVTQDFSDKFAGRATRTGETRGAYSTLVGKETTVKT